MSRMLRRRPSPSMVVAFIALCVALAGTANALPGRARVKKDDIARAAVRSHSTSSRTAVRSRSTSESRDVTRSKIARARSSSDRGRPGRAHGREHRGVVARHGSRCVERHERHERRQRATVNSRSIEKMAFVAVAGTGADARS